VTTAKLFAGAGVMPTIRLAGEVVLDPDYDVPHFAGCTGRVTRLDCTPASGRVLRDQTILTIVSDGIYDRQAFYLRALASGSTFAKQLAAEGLDAVGMTDKQIWSLGKRRSAGSYLDVRVRDDGCVSRILQQGTEFRPGQALFVFNPGRRLLIRVELERELLPYITRAARVQVRDPHWPGELARHLDWHRRKGQRQGETHIVAWIDLASFARHFALGQQVTITVPAPKLSTPRVGLTWLERLLADRPRKKDPYADDPEMQIARANGWTYPLPPRGCEREKYGLAPEPPPAVASRDKALASDGSAGQTTELSTTGASSYLAPWVTEQYPRYAHRFSLTFSLSRWRQRGIRTAQAAPWRDRVEATFDAVLGFEQAPLSPLDIATYVGGRATVMDYPKCSIVDTGGLVATIDIRSSTVQQLAYLAAADGASGAVAEAASALMAIGFPPAALRQLNQKRRIIETVSIVAPRPGLISVLNEENTKEVVRGEVLASLTPASVCFVDGAGPALQLDKFPPRVRAELRSSSDEGWLTMGDALSLIVDRGKQAGAQYAPFRINLPARPPLGSQTSLQPGASVQIRISDPTSERRIVVIPEDAIVMIGASEQVLVHTLHGRLTPTIIERGANIHISSDLKVEGVADAGTVVEVRVGLFAGETVVRNLAQLMAADTDISALMLGFLEFNDREY
jgi:hypothetical protein